MGVHEAPPELLGWMVVGRTSFASEKYSKIVSPSCVGLGHKSSLSLWVSLSWWSVTGRKWVAGSCQIVGRQHIFPGLVATPSKPRQELL